MDDPSALPRIEMKIKPKHPGGFGHDRAATLAASSHITGNTKVGSYITKIMTFRGVVTQETAVA